MQNDNDFLEMAPMSDDAFAIIRARMAAKGIVLEPVNDGDSPQYLSDLMQDTIDYLRTELNA